MPDPWVSGDEENWRTVFSPARIFNPKAFQSGGAGMAGTAHDVMQLLEMLRTGGGNFLSPEMARAALANQIGEIEGEPGYRFTFVGGLVTDPAAAMTALPKGAIQWGGVYGSTWFHRSRAAAHRCQPHQQCAGRLQRRLSGDAARGGVWSVGGCLPRRNDLGRLAPRLSVRRIDVRNRVRRHTLDHRIHYRLDHFGHVEEADPVLDEGVKAVSSAALRMAPCNPPRSSAVRASRSAGKRVSSGASKSSRASLAKSKRSTLSAGRFG